MKNEYRNIDTSIVKSNFALFFEETKHLYNLVFLKKEQSTDSKNIKRYANELFKAERISDYIYELIQDALNKYTLLLEVKAEPKLLTNLNKWINSAVKDISAEINELTSK